MPNPIICDPPSQAACGDGRDRPAPQREGLVSYQQSLKPVQPPCGAVAGTSSSPAASAARLAALRDPTSQADQGDKPRYKITLTNGSEVICIDAHEARLSRCQRRVHAWATALPNAPRVVRRANRKLKIGPRMVMLTLTYSDIDAWEKNQIRDFMVELREEIGKGLYGYSWVLEMQKRGAPHYHVLLYVKRGTKIPKPDEKMWKYGMSRIETVNTPFYICKYTSKKSQKVYQKEGFPPGARMFAVKIYQSDVPEEELFIFKISAVPAWLRPHLLEVKAQTSEEVKYRRYKGGGWLIVNTGEVICSTWKVISIERMG